MIVTAYPRQFPDQLFAVGTVFKLQPSTWWSYTKQPPEYTELWPDGTLRNPLTGEAFPQIAYTHYVPHLAFRTPRSLLYPREVYDYLLGHRWLRVEACEREENGQFRLTTQSTALYPAPRYVLTDGEVLADVQRLDQLIPGQQVKLYFPEELIVAEMIRREVLDDQVRVLFRKGSISHWRTASPAERVPVASHQRVAIAR